MSALAGFDGKYKGVMKDDILKVLKSPKGKAALNDLSLGKKKAIFPRYEDLDGVTDSDITDFIEKNYQSLINLY